MKKKIFAIVCLLVAFLGSLYGLNIEYNIEEENTVETIENSDETLDEIENTSDEVFVSEQAEEIVRDTVQATLERRGFIYNRRD